jgi:hypothetical protein
MTVKIHYSHGYHPQKEEQVKKNTLMTEKKDEWLYFGISRCNFILKDTFSKKEGRKFAAEQLEKAKQLFSAPFCGFTIDQSGLFGYCHESMKAILYEYFAFVDKHAWHSKVVPVIQRQKKKAA